MFGYFTLCVKKLYMCTQTCVIISAYIYTYIFVSAVEENMVIYRNIVPKYLGIWVCLKFFNGK